MPDVTVEINADGWANMIAYLNSVVLRAGVRVENKAKQRCPVSPGGGRLRSSIRTQVQDEHDSITGAGQISGGTSTGTQPVAVVIGSDVEYAPYVEMGTYKMPPRPYLRSSIAEVIAEGLK